jgi:hypothetical protein
MSSIGSIGQVADPESPLTLALSAMLVTIAAR